MRHSSIAPIVATIGIAALFSPPVLALNPLDVRPILSSVDNPETIDNGLDENTQYSFGYAFDVNDDGYFANALGFGFQHGWLAGNESSSYLVTLWKVLLDETDPNLDQVNPLVSATFDPADSNLTSTLFDSAIGGSTHGRQGLYYWLSIPRTDLLKSSHDPLSYYLVGVSGRFAGDGAILPRALGSLNFTPAVASYIFEGYNDIGGSNFPAPFDCFPLPNSDPSDPILCDPKFDAQGFWNVNVSLDVPGPLPLMGVGAAFGWSRRLKRKTSSLRKP